jgi:hypothetical protein
MSRSPSLVCQKGEERRGEERRLHCAWLLTTCAQLAADATPSSHAQCHTNVHSNVATQNPRHATVEDPKILWTGKKAQGNRNMQLKNWRHRERHRETETRRERERECERARAREIRICRCSLQVWSRKRNGNRGWWCTTRRATTTLRDSGALLPLT